MRDNVRRAVLAGLVMATIYSAFAGAMYILDSSTSSAEEGITLGAVILTYYAAGAVGGVVTGVMLPLGRTRYGRMLIGVSAALVFFFCAYTAMDGPVWSWNRDAWEGLIFLSLLFGVALALMWRKVTGS